MSQQLISHSPDLSRLVAEGYEVEIDAGHLVIGHVPYVNEHRNVAYGKLVAPLTLAGEMTTTPNSHVVMFAGAHPCDQEGKKLESIAHESKPQQISDKLVVDHSFSSKPVNSTGYRDYHAQMTTYIAIILKPALALDSRATARTYPVIETTDDEVFKYRDTASSRAGIAALSEKLSHHKIGIIGLGGTGSYILDLIAKTPVLEIHLFDDDNFLQHNAFRSPGAPTISKLRARKKKVNYWAEKYRPMRRRIHPHYSHINEKNANLLDNLNLSFVFICVDRGDVKQPIIKKLESLNIPFIDVGMGIRLVDNRLLGLVRLTTSTPKMRRHVYDERRIALTGGDADGIYSHNIQIGELNALNAALAVIRWKKFCGFFHDYEHEHHSIYTLDGNHILNEDRCMQ